MTGPVVRFDPAAATWPALVASAGANISAEKRLFRQELGLPADGPIIMSGHQCAFWHGGILAKMFAAAALRTAISGAHAAWLWVDQDADETGTLRVPIRDERGVLQSRTWQLKRPPGDEVPASSAPAFTPEPFVEASRAALPHVAEGLQAIHTSLTANKSAPSAARQTAAAASTLLSPLFHELGGVPNQLFATAISNTTAWRELISRIAADPTRVARTYNDAVRASPPAGVAPLAIESSRVELPIWKLPPGHPRSRISSDRLASIDPSHLAPRALLMTGLLRWLGCDLFIHGTGGAAYDAITERWLRDLLGITLAPTVMATADLTLPIPAPDVSMDQVQRAAWLAHSARHDPMILHASAFAGEKQSLLAQINTARERGEHPHDLYKRMHEVLERYRAAHNSDLDRLDLEASAIRERLAESTVARDRTWPFAFHARGALDSLRDSVFGAILGTPATPGSR